MVIKTKLIGTGKAGDSYRVALPTYALIHGNITQGTAIVSIPDDIHGLTEEDLKHETVEETTDGPHYPKLCDECVNKLHDHFDQTYKEHAGKFRIERG